ncbi:MAG: nuclear transport factor 2 family protein [Pseudomonadota bacterium]
MDMQQEILELRRQLGVLQDKDAIRELQYSYGYFIDNRMFREMADLFADQGAWMEIGNRGRYLGKERIHDFLHQVLGNGRWGLLRDEVINHVQQQMIITINEDRQHARARSRAQVQGNSPPDTPHFLLADGIYENEYVREGGRWKILGITVTMTFYASLVRDRIWFPTAPPSEALPPDAASQPVDAALGRQFNPFHFRHPLTGKPLPTPHS